jgi:hypothetical protein
MRSALTLVRLWHRPLGEDSLPLLAANAGRTERSSESGSSSLVGERTQGSDSTMTTRIEHY